MNWEHGPTGSTLSHLECTGCGARFPADELHNLCLSCSRVLFARYDLKQASAAFRSHDSASKDAGLWKWLELLPVRQRENVVTLGEGGTPLLESPSLGRACGGGHVLIKDEGQNPTGSFKARGLSVAVSRAKELGVDAVAIPSAGNAGAAAAAYAARAGLEAYVFVPVDTPAAIVRETAVYGAHVFGVRGLISDAGKIVRSLAPERGWFDLSTLKEPYRAEGKKTMAYELAEQFGWSMPDAILYPTGGGTGIVGMWKAFDEMESLGWIDSRRPRMIAVQSEGCAPIVRAFQSGGAKAEPWVDAHTIAPGIRVPSAVADYLILDIIRSSGGTAITVSDTEIIDAIGEMARLAGLFPAPEGAATWAAYKLLRSCGVLCERDRVVLFNTGVGLKTTELIVHTLPVLEPDDLGQCRREVDRG